MTQALGLQPGNPEKSKDQPCFDYLCRMMDRDKDRQVTEFEFNAYWKTRFDDSDSNKDGKISVSELLADTLFNHLDIDNSSSISFEEYLQNIQPHFPQHDINNDGFLQKGEIWN